MEPFQIKSTKQRWKKIKAGVLNQQKRRLPLMLFNQVINDNEENFAQNMNQGMDDDDDQNHHYNQKTKIYSRSRMHLDEDAYINGFLPHFESKTDVTSLNLNLNHDAFGRKDFGNKDGSNALMHHNDQDKLQEGFGGKNIGSQAGLNQINNDYKGYQSNNGKVEQSKEGSLISGLQGIINGSGAGAGFGGGMGSSPMLSPGLRVKQTLKMVPGKKHNDLEMPSYNSTAYMEKPGQTERQDDKDQNVLLSMLENNDTRVGMRHSSHGLESNAASDGKFLVQKSKGKLMIVNSLEQSQQNRNRDSSTLNKNGSLSKQHQLTPVYQKSKFQTNKKRDSQEDLVFSNFNLQSRNLKNQNHHSMKLRGLSNRSSIGPPSFLLDEQTLTNLKAKKLHQRMIFDKLASKDPQTILKLNKQQMLQIQNGSSIGAAGSSGLLKGSKAPYQKDGSFLPPVTSRRNQNNESQLVQSKKDSSFFQLGERQLLKDAAQYNEPQQSSRGDFGSVGRVQNTKLLRNGQQKYQSDNNVASIRKVKNKKQSQRLQTEVDQSESARAQQDLNVNHHRSTTQTLYEEDDDETAKHSEDCKNNKHRSNVAGGQNGSHNIITSAKRTSSDAQQSLQLQADNQNQNADLRQVNVGGSDLLQGSQNNLNIQQSCQAVFEDISSQSSGRDRGRESSASSEVVDQGNIIESRIKKRVIDLMQQVKHKDNNTNLPVNESWGEFLSSGAMSPIKESSLGGKQQLPNSLSINAHQIPLFQKDILDYIKAPVRIDPNQHFQQVSKTDRRNSPPKKQYITAYTHDNADLQGIAEKPSDSEMTKLAAKLAINLNSNLRPIQTSAYTLALDPPNQVIKGQKKSSTKDLSLLNHNQNSKGVVSGMQPQNNVVSTPSKFKPVLKPKQLKKANVILNNQQLQDAAGVGLGDQTSNPTSNNLQRINQDFDTFKDASAAQQANENYQSNIKNGNKIHHLHNDSPQKRQQNLSIERVKDSRKVDALNLRRINNSSQGSQIGSNQNLDLLHVNGMKSRDRRVGEGVVNNQEVSKNQTNTNQESKVVIFANQVQNPAPIELKNHFNLDQTLVDKMNGQPKRVFHNKSHSLAVSRLNSQQESVVDSVSKEAQKYALRKRSLYSMISRQAINRQKARGISIDSDEEKQIKQELSIKKKKEWQPAQFREDLHNILENQSGQGAEVEFGLEQELLDSRGGDVESNVFNSASKRGEGAMDTAEKFREQHLGDPLIYEHQQGITDSEGKKQERKTVKLLQGGNKGGDLTRNKGRNVSFKGEAGKQYISDQQSYQNMVHISQNNNHEGRISQTNERDQPQNYLKSPKLFNNQMIKNGKNGPFSSKLGSPAYSRDLTRSPSQRSQNSYSSIAIIDHHNRANKHSGSGGLDQDQDQDQELDHDEANLNQSDEDQFNQTLLAGAKGTLRIQEKGERSLLNRGFTNSGGVSNYHLHNMDQSANHGKNLQNHLKIRDRNQSTNHERSSSLLKVAQQNRNIVYPTIDNCKELNKNGHQLQITIGQRSSNNLSSNSNIQQKRVELQKLSANRMSKGSYIRGEYQNLVNNNNNNSNHKLQGAAKGGLQNGNGPPSGQSSPQNSPFLRSKKSQKVVSDKIVNNSQQLQMQQQQNNSAGAGSGVGSANNAEFNPIKVVIRQAVGGPNKVQR